MSKEHIPDVPKQTEEIIRNIALFPEENPCPVLRVDKGGVLLYANRASEKLLAQWQCDVGKAVPDFVMHELSLALTSSLTRELETGCGDREFSFALVPIIERDYVNFYGRDVTKSKQTEQALRESEQRYRNLFHNNHAVMLLIDPRDGRITDANTAACNYYGYTPEEIKSLKISDINTLPHDGVSEAIEKVSSKQSRHFCFQHRLADGNVRDVEVFSGTIVIKGRELLYSIVHDITDRKRADEEIERLNADLVTRAEELREINRQLEAFNYTVAHDLRKPLTIINGYSEILTEMCGDKLDDQCTRFLRMISDKTLNMSQLIDDLLNFSRLTYVELNSEAADLSKIAKDVVKELKLAEPRRQVEFRIAEEICVVGDVSLLRVAMVNLFGNAWKYTAHRENAVIEFGMAQNKDRSVYFVRDNGIGFIQEDVEKLFLPFKRLPGSRGISGFGIGLATVERIVHHHGGKIWAEGKPDEGATFYFTLSG